MSKAILVLGGAVAASVSALAVSILAYREAKINNNLTYAHHEWLHNIEDTIEKVANDIHDDVLTTVGGRLDSLEEQTKTVSSKVEAAITKASRVTKAKVDALATETKSNVRGVKKTVKAAAGSVAEKIVDAIEDRKDDVDAELKK